MKHSIRNKILMLNLSALLLCALCLGGIAFYFFSDYIGHDSDERLQLLCEKESIKVNLTLQSIEQYVKTLSYIALDDVNSSSDITNDSSRNFITGQNLNFIDATIRNISGAVAVYVRYNPKIAPPTSGIFMTADAENGDIHKETPTDFSKFDPNDNERVGWYYIPVHSGKPLWMDPYENKNINIYMISYVIPLFKAGEEIGVVGMDINFDYVISEIKRINLYKTGYAYLENANGKIVYHPNLAMGETANEADMKIIRKAISNGMRLVFAVPVSEFNEDRNLLIIRIAVLSVLFILLFAFISISVAGGIVRPLTALTKAADQMTKGNLEVNFDTLAKDEIGDLSRSFESARKYIKGYLGYVKGIAYKDSLTGVRNKAAYDNFVQNIEPPISEGKISEIGAVALDVNCLKKVNDTYGHDHGNMLLKNACRLVCKTFCHSPVFRTGGDEFIVILQNDDFKNRESLMAALRKNMAEMEAGDNVPWERVSIAAGLATLTDKGETLKAVVNRADEAMYKNKIDMKMGRG